MSKNSAKQRHIQLQEWIESMGIKPKRKGNDRKKR